MIADLKQRSLKWIFVNVYKPANPENLSERQLTLVAQAVDEFCVFAGGDPAVEAIGDGELKAFTRFLRAKNRSDHFAWLRRRRVSGVVGHVAPPPVDICAAPPCAASLREYANDRATMKLIAGPNGDVDWYAKHVLIAIRHLCRFVGKEVLLSEVSSELIGELEESFNGSATAKQYAWLLRKCMRTVDPIAFRKVYAPGRPGGRPAQFRNQPGNSSTYFLDNLYAEAYEPRRLRSCRPNTKRLYRHSLRAFAQFLGRAPIIDDLNNETLDRFAVKRREEKVAASSINRDLENLLAIWRWCCDQNILEKRPDIQLERVPRQVPVAWLKTEMFQLIRTIRQLKGDVGLHAARDWWAALVQVIFCSGERINAVTALNWRYVDLASRVVIFQADDRKGGVDPNPVRLSAEAVKALRRIQAESGPVFPWPHHPTYLWAKYGRILSAAGLPNDRWRKFHCIRKTVGSHIEAAGGNATQALKHSDRRVTEAYLDPRITKPQQPVDVLFRLTEIA